MDVFAEFEKELRDACKLKLGNLESELICDDMAGVFITLFCSSPHLIKIDQLILLKYSYFGSMSCW